ncbi:hypothetical protein [uncultured Ilyobacter sp.]|uniref:hypothetical protein n=1 Tax=uncultured Ilyobacter sp. TaxID=544433 RepID=UPI0029C66BAD|nr:hypothetical protein [uncultured Ilyobacter sp.]
MRYLYAQKYRLKDIAKMTGVPVEVVEIIKKQSSKNGKSWVKSMRNEQLESDVIALYRKGHSIGEISRKTRVDESTIRGRRDRARASGNPW